MAILTPDLVDYKIAGQTGFFGSDRRLSNVFNLYFTWGYDSARVDHPEHWEDFKSAIKEWADI